MSDWTDDRMVFQEKSWKLLNLQMDTLLKDAQRKTEIWKLVVAAMTAGAAVTVALVALLKSFG